VSRTVLRRARWPGDVAISAGRITGVEDLGGLGVDGVASNEFGGLLPELRMATFLARQRTQDPTAFVPADALYIATEGGARCLGRDDIGRLEPGARADVVVWPGDDLADVLDPLAGFVLDPERRAPHVLVDGEAVVADGALVGADLAALRADLPGGLAGSGQPEPPDEQTTVAAVRHDRGRDKARHGGDGDRQTATGLPGGQEWSWRHQPSR